MSKEINKVRDIFSIAHPWLVAMIVVSICAFTMVTRAQSSDPISAPGAAGQQNEIRCADYT